jgi:hypothetical protein
VSGSTPYLTPYRASEAPIDSEASDSENGRTEGGVQTLGQFADQPTIDVTFDMPDPATGGTKTVTVPVHRGTTGVVTSTMYPSLGYDGGREVQAIVDDWEGDTPITRVEIVRR